MIYHPGNGTQKYCYISCRIYLRWPFSTDDDTVCSLHCMKQAADRKIEMWLMRNEKMLGQEKEEKEKEKEKEKRKEKEKCSVEYSAFKLSHLLAQECQATSMYDKKPSHNSQHCYNPFNSNQHWAYGRLSLKHLSPDVAFLSTWRSLLAFCQYGKYIAIETVPSPTPCIVQASHPILLHISRNKPWSKSRRTFWAHTESHAAQ